MWAGMSAVWGSGLGQTRERVPGFPAGFEVGPADDGGHLGKRVVGVTCCSVARDGAVGVAAWVGQSIPLDWAEAFPAPAK